jgi:putative ATP-dependent endonuclease of the OLD family
MHLSLVTIVNFRNFAELVVPLAANVLMLGENRVGKSNFILALRLVLDSFLPDSARELKLGGKSRTRSLMRLVLI